MIELKINGQKRAIKNATPDTPLLWALRDELGLTGTKYGCGIAACGACTVLINGMARRSCQLPIDSIVGEITTIEGYTPDDGLSYLQQAWIDHQVAQCGYCQSGQIINAAALLEQNSAPTDADIDEAMSGNLCRCGTYPRIRAAIHAAAKMRAEG